MRLLEKIIRLIPLLGTFAGLVMGLSLIYYGHPSGKEDAAVRAQDGASVPEPAARVTTSEFKSEIEAGLPPEMTSEAYRQRVMGEKPLSLDPIQVSCTYLSGTLLTPGNIKYLQDHPDPWAKSHMHGSFDLFMYPGRREFMVEVTMSTASYGDDVGVIQIIPSKEPGVYDTTFVVAAAQGIAPDNYVGMNGFGEGFNYRPDSFGWSRNWKMTVRRADIGLEISYNCAVPSLEELKW